ncbi:TniB family NTP-binding protein [Shewanella sp. 10N.286.48.A6]|uniref:TniB family NTP-binding protein n=1 Tax=Shewanella sp. 10N.286.48.A6 TaxID=1880833 RepID=UPI000C8160F6|nr:TniB family NTP-binding protein [Shewanella sp. 10N.286.48.A6]PMH96288.1 hypothetical protein BCU55_19375 [Shewanella sp. 10N.286.48.A6]
MVIRNLAIELPSNQLHQSTQIMKALDKIKLIHAMYDKPNVNKKALLIYGGSGEGKTHLLKTYQKQFKPVKTREKQTIPVFYYAIRQGKRSVDEFLKTLIAALGGPIAKGRVNSSELEHQFIILLRDLNVEIILLDEIQNLSTTYDGIVFQGIIKNLCWLIDEENIRCSIVFAGSHLAKRLMTFGSKDKKLNDNEQLSRRMLRSICLSRMPPSSKSWVSCVNWHLNQVGLPPITHFNEAEKLFIDSVYIAYLERSMSSLNDLFIQDNCINSKSIDDLLVTLESNFDTYCKGSINPFRAKNTDKVKETIRLIKIAAKKDANKKANQDAYEQVSCN